MSLYLKYRPQSFDSVVGQDHVLTTLKNASKYKALNHAYLFSGPRGTGKTSTARILAKLIMTQDMEDEAKKVIVIEGIERGNMVDLIEIDAASNRGIDEIRELRDKIQFAPNQASAKVYIIDEVHMLTKEAFNALLKTLEEPPSHAYFILATTEAHKIPETIISRCQQFSFKRITTDIIVERLRSIAKEEGIKTEEKALELLAKLARGGMRDAIGMFEQMILEKEVTYDNIVQNMGLGSQMLVESFFKALLDKDPQAAIDIITEVNTQGHNLNQFTTELISFLREQMLLGISRNEKPGSIVELIEIFSEAKLQINQAVIPQLPLEIAIVKACGYSVAETPETEQTAVETKASESEKDIEKEPDSPKATSEPKKDEALIQPAIEISLESIKENWQRVLDNIDTPFIRTSFMDGEPVKYEKGRLHVAFKSETFKEKIESPSNQVSIYKAFENVFNDKVHLTLEMKKIDLKPVSAKIEAKEPSIVDMAKEVFGG